MSKRKIALFGGSFDPIHLGHTTVAASAAKQIEAQEVVFIPAKSSPLKDVAPNASDNDRLRMIELAIEKNKNYQLSDYEINKPSPSYTLHTVRYFQHEYGDRALICWLIGADSLDELPRWYGVTDLIDECNLCTMFRAGCEEPDFTKFAVLWGHERVAKLQKNIIKTPFDPKDAEIFIFI